MYLNVDTTRVVIDNYTLYEALEKAGKGRFQLLLTITVGAMTATNAWQNFMMIFLVPIVKDNWDLDRPWVTMIHIAFFLGMLCGNILMSKLADVYGRRKVLILGMNLLAISSVATVFAYDIYFMLICRFFSGLGHVQPVAYILLLEYSP